MNNENNKSDVAASKPSTTETPKKADTVRSLGAALAAALAANDQAAVFKIAGELSQALPKKAAAKEAPVRSLAEALGATEMQAKRSGRCYEGDTEVTGKIWEGVQGADAFKDLEFEIYHTVKQDGSHVVTFVAPLLDTAKMTVIDDYFKSEKIGIANFGVSEDFLFGSANKLYIVALKDAPLGKFVPAPTPKPREKKAVPPAPDSKPKAESKPNPVGVVIHKRSPTAAEANKIKANNKASQA